jgi:hypothetical protein
MRLLSAGLLAVSMAGCYSSSALDGDVGPVDAARGACDPVGSLVACGEGCGGHFPCTAMGGVYGCLEGVCVRQGEDPRPARDELSFSCDLPRGGWPMRRFSYRGDHACYLSRFMSGRREDLVRGFTMPESDCNAMSSDLGLDCYWSDGSIRTRTPPPVHTTCPAAPNPGSVLCGGPCGNCEYTIVGDIGSYDVPCLGRNDDRDLGVCGLVIDMTEGCSPEVPAGPNCLDPLIMDMEWPGASCACLSFRREDGFERAGWSVPTTNCATYRALYPGQVECYDDAWTPLP